jgi:hypothetical protein
VAARDVSRLRIHFGAAGAFARPDKGKLDDEMLDKTANFSESV